MSYILEALKKSDAERKRGDVPTLSDAPAAPASGAPSATNPITLLAAGAVAFIAIGGLGAWLLLGDDEAPAPVQVAQQAPQQVVEATPAPAPEPAPEPEPLPEPEPVPEPAPEPVSAPEPQPMPAAQEVTVLEAKPAPAPQVEAKGEPIPEPISVVRPEPKPERKPVAAAKTKTRTLPTLKSAGAYVDRAWSSMDKGLYAQAINDLDLALSREPAFADAWFARGWALEKSGDAAAAVLDYGRAIDAKPDHAFALFSRGFLNLYGGKPRAAVVDFVRTQGVAEDESLRLYSHLWLYLSRARANQNAPVRLKDDAARENLSHWPGPLLQHFLGTRDEPAVRAAIETGPKEGLKERRATGYFFLGISAQLAGDKSRARAYFEKTLATGAVDFRQYDAAKRELDALP